MPVLSRLPSMLLLAAGLVFAPACAQAGPPPGERMVQGQMPRLSASDTLAMCFQRNRDPASRSACIGEYAEACMALSPDGETTAGMVRCTNGEYEAWDVELNEAYAALQDGLTEAQTTALRDAQRDWIALRDAECRYEASRFEGGSMARIETANCLLRQTAERTIRLQRWAAE